MAARADDWKDLVDWATDNRSSCNDVRSIGGPLQRFRLLLMSSVAQVLFCAPVLHKAHTGVEKSLLTSVTTIHYSNSRNLCL